MIGYRREVLADGRVKFDTIYPEVKKTWSLPHMAIGSITQQFLDLQEATDTMIDLAINPCTALMVVPQKIEDKVRRVHTDYSRRIPTRVEMEEFVNRGVAECDRLRGVINFEHSCAIQPSEIKKTRVEVNHRLRGQSLRLKFVVKTEARVYFNFGSVLDSENIFGAKDTSGELCLSEMVIVDQGEDVGRRARAKELVRVRRVAKKARAARSAVKTELRDDAVEVLTATTLDGEVTGYQTTRNREEHTINQGFRMSGWGSWRAPASRRLSEAARDAQTIRMEQQGVESELAKQERLEAERIKATEMRIRKLLGR